MGDKRVLILGATGMIGGISLRICLATPDVQQVTVITRRPTSITDPKLREVIHSDFLDYTSCRDAFADQDAALFCLGAYTGTLPDDEFRKVTVDYALGFAEALRGESPAASLAFLSGQGADLTERSRIAFARYKGMAENALLKMEFPQLHIFRPGYIYPVDPRKEPNLAYRLFRIVYPLARVIYPNIGIDSGSLARAMVEAALSGTGKLVGPVIENRDIRVFADSLDRRTSGTSIGGPNSDSDRFKMV